MTLATSTAITQLCNACMEGLIVASERGELAAAREALADRFSEIAALALRCAVKAALVPQRAQETLAELAVAPQLATQVYVAGIVRDAAAEVIEEASWI